MRPNSRALVCRASLSFFQGAIDNVPARRKLEQFFNPSNADSMVMDHGAQASDPLQIVQGVVAPLALSQGIDEPFFFIDPQRPRMHFKHVCCSANGKDWFVLIHAINCLPDLLSRLLVPQEARIVMGVSAFGNKHVITLFSVRCSIGNGSFSLCVFLILQRQPD